MPYGNTWHGLSKEYQIQCSYETVVRFERIWLTMKARWFNNAVCKNEQQLLERLDPAILGVMNNPKRLKKLPVSQRYYDKRSK